MSNNLGAETSSDAGLIAVHRVREVRETQALALYRQAMRLRDEHAAEVGRLETQLLRASAEQAEIGSVVELSEVLNLRMRTARINHALRHTRAELATAEHALVSARQRWEAAKTRLAAVEQLLERRRHERRVELDRKLGREADDLAGQAWLRAMAAEPPAPRASGASRASQGSTPPPEEGFDAVNGVPLPVVPCQMEPQWANTQAAVLDFRRPR